MPNKPLDMKYLENFVENDDDAQLEIISERNDKFTALRDHELDDKIKAYNGYLRELPLEPTKLHNVLKDLEREKEFRSREKANQVPLRNEVENNCGVHGGLDNVRPLSSSINFHEHFQDGDDVSSKVEEKARVHKQRQTGCIERRTTRFPACDEEIEILPGKTIFLHRSPNTDVTLKDKNRAFSGEQAGPSRLGLRSRSKLCSTCKNRLELQSFLPSGTGKNSDVLCGFCQKQRKLLEFSPIESPKENSSLGAPSGKKVNGGKRARQGATGGGTESPDAVVELFSSEDEEDQDIKSNVVDCKVLNQRKGYGLRSAVSVRMEGVKIAYPSRDDPDAVEVQYHDLHRLEPLEFLNDTVIDFYIKYMQRPDVLKLELKSKIHFFNSFFYKKLSELISTQSKKHGPDLSKLRKWTKGTNIFEKDYLFFPIHDKWHWSLAIVCHPGAGENSDSDRCILHLDSMSPGHKSSIVFRFLRTYLLTEWDHQAEEDGTGILSPRLTNDSFTTKKVQVPQQENETDCGLFLLHYLERFLKIAPTSFRLHDVDDGNLFGKSWFKPSEASGLRKEIRELLQSFFETEATKATVNAETNERLSEPGQLLHVDTCEVRLPDMEVDVDMDADPSHPSECVVEVTTKPETFGVSAEKMVGVVQHVEPDFLRIDERTSPNCADVGTPRSRRSLDPETHVSRKKMQRIGSVDDIEEENQLRQLNSLDGDLDGESQGECELFVDLPIRKDKYPQTIAHV